MTVIKNKTIRLLKTSVVVGFIFSILYIVIFANNAYAENYGLTPAGSSPLEMATGESANSGEGGTIASKIGDLIGESITELLKSTLAPVVYLLFGLSSLFLGLGGGLLDNVIKHTVVNMSTNLGPLLAGAGGISVAWSALRDVANIFFIFILLYIAIGTILRTLAGGNTQRLIVRVIIAALLINFSLFFTKIIIDVSNALAVAFYNSIIEPGGPNVKGIGDAFYRFMNLLTVFKGGLAGDINPKDIFTVSAMGTMFNFIAGFVFLSAVGMFVARYVVLIFLMVTSPLAFAASALPNDKYSGKWWDALWGQVLFAPAYIILVWVTLKIMGGVLAFDPDLSWFAAFVSAAKNVTAASVPANSMIIVMNFMIIIGFMIGSLTVAKQLSGSAGRGISKWVGGVVGGAVIGTSARVLRGTVGASAARVANDENLKARAAQGDKAALFTLKQAERVSKASFDVRGTAFGKQLDLGRPGGKGGFDKELKDEEKFVKGLAPSDVVIDRAEQRLANAKTPEERAAAEREIDRLKGISVKEAQKRTGEREKVREKQAETEMAKRKSVIEKDVATEKIAETEELKSTRSNLTIAREKLSRSPLVGPEREQMQKDIVQLEQKEREVIEKIRKERIEELIKQATKAVEASIPQVEKVLTQPSLAQTRQRAYAEHIEQSRSVFSPITWTRSGRLSLAATTRKVAKGKDFKQKVAEAFKTGQEEGEIEGTEEETTTPTPPEGTPPAGGGTTTT